MTVLFGNFKFQQTNVDIFHYTPPNNHLLIEIFMILLIHPPKFNPKMQDP